MPDFVSSYLSNATAPEIGALVFGVAYVALAARGNVLCWPAGILASGLSIVIAARSNYLADVVKESYYVAMGFYGWFFWTQKTADDAVHPITTRSVAFNTRLIVAGAALSVLVGYYFSTLGSSLPYLDAATTVFAFSTTWLVARRILENWLYWIVINTAGIYMYVRTGAYFFSLLLALYTVFAVLGYVRWKTLMQTPST